MMYVRLKLFRADGPSIDKLLDFLETDLNITFDWLPNKTLVRMSTKDDQDIKGFEAYMTYTYKFDAEWEFHDDEDQMRYIAQKLAIHNDIVNKLYLIPFNENIDFMKDQ